MQYNELVRYTEAIKQCPFFGQKNSPCIKSNIIKPVINVILPSQKYMIISSDPASDTDKNKGNDVPHSNFALRFLALMFTGNDSNEQAERILLYFAHFQNIFSNYFYWTHYNKCYAAGIPNNYCAKLYLEKEIELFSPKLIISLGKKPIDLLFGGGKLADRVNRILSYGNISVIASLHPSRDWNLRRRDKFSFVETWNLIRRTVKYTKKDSLKLSKLLEA